MVPFAAKPNRTSQSVGGMQSEASTQMMTKVDAQTSGSRTVTKAGSRAASNYPDYFLKPKDNLLEGQRGSRYDQNKPRTFNLTVPETSLA